MHANRFDIWIKKVLNLWKRSERVHNLNKHRNIWKLCQFIRLIQPDSASIDRFPISRCSWASVEHTKIANNRMPMGLECPEKSGKHEMRSFRETSETTSLPFLVTRNFSIYFAKKLSIIKSAHNDTYVDQCNWVCRCNLALKFFHSRGCLLAWQIKLATYYK